MSEPSVLTFNQTSAQQRVSLKDEHERLGHIGQHKLIRLVHEDNSHADALLDPSRITAFTTCHRMRIAHKSKNGISPNDTGPAELVHVDVDCPIETSLYGYDHFLAILDDYWRMYAVVPMNGRKATFPLLKENVNRIEMQVGERVRSFGRITARN